MVRLVASQGSLSAVLFQKTILDSIQKEDSSFKGDGYTSLAVIYAMLALGNWVAPSIIGSLGPRLSMVIGSITYFAGLAILCSGLLGFADSCFNTQVYAAIGTVFSDRSAPAFAIFKFIQ
ncbi:unnamed protein product, partial [Nesidiocoris tenuis]